MAINEGQTIQYTVTTTNTADGTVLYWQTTGSVSNSDISGGNTGSITITNNRAVWNVTLLNDVLTEGNETLGISLSTGSLSGPVVVSTANPITITDTSTAPVYALYTWGWNPFGNLGTNDTVYRSSPTQVGSDTTWANVSSSIFATSAIKTNGTLWTWGSPNGQGTTGQNNNISISSPTQVGSATDWKDVAAGTYTFLARKTNGTIWTWGRSAQGQTGDNAAINRSSPVQVGAGTNWGLISCGTYHCASIKTDGTLWIWGNNSFGQVADGTQLNRSSPTQVGALTNWSLISGGNYGTVAVKTNGTLWAWGLNNYGELGQNNIIARSSPVQVGVGTDWASASSGCSAGVASAFVVAIKTNGTLWTWGENASGELGLNDTISRSSPVQVGAATNWAKAFGGNEHCFITKTDGTLWSMGTNGNGELGKNNLVKYSSPVQIGSATNWGVIGTGSRAAHRFAITSS